METTDRPSLRSNELGTETQPCRGRADAPQRQD